jgi:predicted nucleic acid-binding protein
VLSGHLALLGADLRSVFVDSGAWIALRLREDQHHEVASRAWERLVFGSVVTTNLVVGETYTYLRRRRGHTEAWRFLDTLNGMRRLTRAFITPEIEALAYPILRQYNDHDFSYVDATSFAFMRSAGISDAFAFDAHFATAGFTRIPVDKPVS